MATVERSAISYANTGFCKQTLHAHSPGEAAGSGSRCCSGGGAGCSRGFRCFTRLLAGVTEPLVSRLPPLAHSMFRSSEVRQGRRIYSSRFQRCLLFPCAFLSVCSQHRKTLHSKKAASHKHLHPKRGIQKLKKSRERGTGAFTVLAPFKVHPNAAQPPRSGFVASTGRPVDAGAQESEGRNDRICARFSPSPQFHLYTVRLVSVPLQTCLAVSPIRG